jgi:lipopolysaccharide biosynthesis glycosyltransferase
MKDDLNVFFAIDRNYLQHFTVALTSLLENNRDLSLKIFLLHDIADDSFFDITVNFIKERYDLEINLISVADIDFSHFKTTEFYPKSTYFRLMLPAIIPEDVNSGLFLDSDLIVNGSIKDLVVVDLSKMFLAAVSEASVEDNVLRLNKLGFPSTGYFNAGVLLVNLEAWRENSFIDDFVSIANNYSEHLPWVDQDILNMHFGDNWVRLDKKYNATHLLKKLPEAPVIVHYASYSKPWHYVNTHPYNSLYKKYLRMTPFKGVRSTGFSLKNFVLKHGRLVKRVLRELKILKEYTPQAH